MNYKLTEQEVKLLQKGIDKLMDDEFSAMLRHNKLQNPSEVIRRGETCRSLVELKKKVGVLLQHQQH